MILTTITIDLIAFIFICGFAIVGGLVVLFILLYIVAGIHDLTYKHKQEENNCPEKIEGEDDR